MRKVSVVIPAFNEEKYIEKCVLSCLAQIGGDFQLHVYVCDGMSTDKTADLVNQISLANKNVSLLMNEFKTAPFALNLGIKAAGSGVVIILGAHSELSVDFVAKNLEILDRFPEVGCSGGLIENVFLDDASEIIGKAMSSEFGVGNAHFRTGAKSGYVDTVAFGAYRYEVFEKIGYFDEKLIRNQDDEFNYRLLKAGFKIYLNPEIRCKYYVRSGLNKMFKQYFQYGFWKVFVNVKHKAVTTIRQLIPFFFVSFLLFFPLLFLAWIGFAFVYLFFLLLYLLCASVFSMKAAGTLKVVPAFFLLHLSYGLGYLKGVLHFIIFRKDAPTHQKITR